MQRLTVLRLGDWRTLLACFLYFDTGFTVWVMFGPLAPYIAGQLALSPSQAGLLVAVPVLMASVLRVTLGNLFQSTDGRRLALLGMALSAVPSLLLLRSAVPSYTQLLVMGGLLGVGGASFAIALPMAGAGYPARVQGLVLGLAAAGNVGAIVDGFVFPRLAEHFGWQRATAAALPLLALSAVAVLGWARDRSRKSGNPRRALAALATSLAGMTVLVLLVASPVGMGGRQSGVLLLPLVGATLALALLPRSYVALARERDCWVLMLVYSITFGGFVGLSSYVSLLLTAQYRLSTVHAGIFMAVLSFVGAMMRPLGGWLADRLSGVRVLRGLLLLIALLDAALALVVPPLLTAAVLLALLYLCFGLGNGATFQLVPHRWRDRSGVMTGVIGAAGGIGGFYLPVVLSVAKERTGSYQLGFAILALIAGLAFVLLGRLRRQWLAWSQPTAFASGLDGAAVQSE